MDKSSKDSYEERAEALYDIIPEALGFNASSQSLN